MNKFIGVGRLTRDPELRMTQNQIPVCSFTIAIDRNHKGSDGERQADFINCVAWRERADFISKYFQKGSRIIVVGSIQTRTYDDKDGNKRTATEAVIDEIYFGESKRDQTQQSASHPEVSQPPVMDEDTSLPFDL